MSKTEDKKEAAEVVDASSSLDARLASYNAENALLMKKYGLVLGSEAYIAEGLIKSRPVAMPIEQMPNNGGDAAK
jgi:hypothetical protein